MFGDEADFDRALRGLRPMPPDLLSTGTPRNDTDNGVPAFLPRTNRPRAGKPAKIQIGPYFQMPYRLFSSGLAARLGRSAGWLYTAMLSHANDHRSMTFSASNKSLACDTGMSPRAIGEAKKKLRHMGLIDYISEPGCNDTYTLKKVELERIKRDERPRLKYKRRGRAAQPADEPIWDGLSQVLRGTGVKYAQPYRKICAPV